MSPIDVVLSSSAQEQNLKSVLTVGEHCHGFGLRKQRYCQPASATDLKAEARLDTAKLSSTGLTEYTLSLTPAK